MVGKLSRTGNVKQVNIFSLSSSCSASAEMPQRPAGPNALRNSAPFAFFAQGSGYRQRGNFALQQDAAAVETGMKTMDVCTEN